MCRVQHNPQAPGGDRVAVPLFQPHLLWQCEAEYNTKAPKSEKGQAVEGKIKEVTQVLYDNIGGLQSVV